MFRHGMWALQDLCLAAFFARYEPGLQCLLTSSAHKSPALSAFAYICADKYSIVSPMARSTFDDALLRALCTNDDRIVELDVSDGRSSGRRYGASHTRGVCGGKPYAGGAAILTLHPDLLQLDMSTGTRWRRKACRSSEE